MMTRLKEIEIRAFREDTSREVLLQDIQWLLKQNRLLKTLLLSCRRGNQQSLLPRLTVWERIKRFFSKEK